MSKGINPIAQTFYDVTGVFCAKATQTPDYGLKSFTYLKNAFTADEMKPINLLEFEQLINNYKNNPKGKQYNNCLLKGLFEDGFSGQNIVQNSPYLFFDIDVKNDEKEKKFENLHLFNTEDNQTIFNELQKLSVIVWRSNSGTGIAGVLYVPQMENYLFESTDLHRTAGKEITNYLSDYLHEVTGIERIKFDNAQSKLRQVRFLATQKVNRFLNPYPFEFSYSVEVKTKESRPGVIAYRPENFRRPYGTIYEQFDNDNSILEIALNNGFTEIRRQGTQIRIKYEDSTSIDSGFIDVPNNVYVNYSQSFDNKGLFTPSEMVRKCQFNNDKTRFEAYLIELGYKEKKKSENELKQIAEKLKTELTQATENQDKIIFTHCYDLQTLTDSEKVNFIKNACPNPDYEKYFKAYLNLIDNKINFDKTFIIKNYVSESLEPILNYADKRKKIILRAETGQGKTTAFIRDFFKYRPNKRILILEPLTVIIRQNEKEYNDKAVFLDGTTVKNEYQNALAESMVIATYEQGTKLLFESKFDYIVIDEAHQLMTANSFKNHVISDLTSELKDSIIIGLTGTPNNVFKEMGFSLINVDLRTPKKTDIEVRYINNKPTDIALSHLRNTTGKTLLRLNDIKGLKELKDHLIKSKLYKKNEILVLYSEKQIKESDDYKRLAHERKFNDKLKLILTTSLIDEGLSIDQNGFTDVVFIETSYTPRPEPIKQFFARFRNEDPERKNYLYLRSKIDQTPNRFYLSWAYKKTSEALENAFDDSSYKTNFDNTNFYYDDGQINKFYLGYSVSDSLFAGMNNDQFKDFLEVNYNLRLTKNKDFDFEIYESLDRKKLKKKFAKHWLKSKDSVFQILALHTLDPRIKKEIPIRQMYFEPKTESFIICYLKDFEKLYKRQKTLLSLGIEDPDLYLIDFENHTLTSESKYKKDLIIIRLKKTIEDPKNESDKKTADKFRSFANWCEMTKEFTYSQMCRELKKIGVHEPKAYSRKKLFIILDWFDLEAKIDFNIGRIIISKKAFL